MWHIIWKRNPEWRRNWFYRISAPVSNEPGQDSVTSSWVQEIGEDDCISSRGCGAPFPHGHSQLYLIE